MNRPHPRRYWGRPPAASDRPARAAYFADWRWQVLPRRGEACGSGRRRYEVRCAMAGIVYTIDDDLSFVAPIAPRVLWAQHFAPDAPQPPRMLDDPWDAHVHWLRRAVDALIQRTGDVTPGEEIPLSDWHMRDLERLRRVAAAAALHLCRPSGGASGAAGPEIHDEPSPPDEPVPLAPALSNVVSTRTDGAHP